MSGKSRGPDPKGQEPQTEPQTEPNANLKPPRKPRKLKLHQADDSQPTSDLIASEVRAEQAAKKHGRLGSALKQGTLTWFVPGWFARGMLNMVIGRKNAGKSSCLAWLMSQAKRPAAHSDPSRSSL
jgi:hypothetical protein